MKVVTTRVTLSDGPLSLFDEDGSAIIIHGNPDQMITGASKSGVSGGPRVACGVIAKIAGGLASAEAEDLAPRRTQLAARSIERVATGRCLGTELRVLGNDQRRQRSRAGDARHIQRKLTTLRLPAGLRSDVPESAARD